jgi:quercetin dioxygenase-like cupin family protein
MRNHAVLAGLLAWALVCGVAGTAEAQAQALPAIAPQLLLENDAVRVDLLTFPPGVASGRHVGLEPEMGIVIEGELTLVTDQGREVLGPGTVHWLPALTPHDARNESDRPVKLWVVLFKRCD